VFGPDGMAYLSSGESNSILRYDSTTGAPAGVSGQAGDAVFVSFGSGGLVRPTAIVFGPDGYLYVTSWLDNNVLRYQASTGAFAGTVVPASSGGLSFAGDLLFEANGNFLVSSRDSNQILRYGNNSDDFFLLAVARAMAHGQLGDRDQARRWYDTAVQRMEKNKPQDEKMRSACAEVAALLDDGRPPKPKDPIPPKKD
jgi:hypothetical protein